MRDFLQRAVQCTLKCSAVWQRNVLGMEVKEVDPKIEPQAKKIKMMSGETTLDDTLGSQLSQNLEMSSHSSFPKEEEVGITEYISSLPGFFAILKQRSPSPSFVTASSCLTRTALPV